MNKYIIIICLLYASLPLFSNLNTFFYLIGSIFLFGLGLTINKYWFINHPIFMVIFRFFFIMTSFLPFLLFYEQVEISIEKITKIPSSTLLKIIIAIIIITFIILMFDFLLTPLKHFKDPKKAKGFVKFEAYLNLAFPLLAGLTFPNLIFGLSYGLVLDTFHGIFLSLPDYYYLGFVINYALPLGSNVPTNIQNSINAINTYPFLRFIEYTHIIIIKIIDLTIIANVIGFINKRIGIFNKNR